MPPHATTAQGDSSDAGGGSLARPESAELQPGIPLADDAEAIVSIELNFNAYADNVPPTRHAKRIATYNDPSVQDFADQALELAALRAELKRLNRDYESLRQSLRARDAQVQALREQLASMRAHETTIVDDSLVAHELSSTVVLPLASCSDIASGKRHEEIVGTPGRKLIPLDHEGQPIPLNRDILTIGRTRHSDICIPSRAVSRDHARLLLGQSGVTLVDRDSANGCFVNDAPVKRHKLRNGDTVRIGDRPYRFVDHQTTDRARSPEPASSP